MPTLGQPVERPTGCGYSTAAGSASSRRTSLTSARLPFTYLLPIWTIKGYQGQQSQFLPEEMDDRSGAHAKIA